MTAEKDIIQKETELELPLFSVIILSYKNNGWLPGMVRTILQQDYPNIELIISDDGSDDFDCRSVEKMVHELVIEVGAKPLSRLLVRKNEKNMKTVAHVARVLPMATGDFVVFSSADDRFSGNNVFSMYVDQFQKHPEAKWLVAQAKLMTADLKKMVGKLPNDCDVPCLQRNDARLLFGRWSRRCLAIPCSMAFRKEAFELAGGIDLSYNLLEDWPLDLHLLLKGYAPIFVEKIVALHGTGGIANSNNRYGVEMRRMFYEDKYLLMNTITEKNLDLLSAEDKKAYKLYRREIMDRNYFLQIDVYTMSKAKLLVESIKKPIKLIWIFETLYLKVDKIIERKKLLLISQFLLLCSAVLMYCANHQHELWGLYRTFGTIDLVASLGCIVVSLISIICKLWINKRAKQRKWLVG